MNKRFIGSKYEMFACNYLVKHNYVILERNFQNRIGEIDIIAKDGDYLCFIEVKERKNLNCGFGLEAVNLKKQKNIIKVAKMYLYIHNYTENQNMRFDVISFDNNNITLIKNAFMEEK